MPAVALAPLGGAWSIWRSVCLRSAGFPAHQVLALAASDAARSTDRLADLQAEQLRVRRAVSVLLSQALSGASQELKARIQQARKNIAKNRPDSGDGLAPPIAAALLQITALRHEAEALTHLLEQQLEAAERAASAAILGATRDEAFLLAVTWQNRRLLREAIASLQRHEGKVDSHIRAKQRLVARYLQRYCLKNESIGAFGPVGWATLATSGPPVAVRPGPQVIARREVFFEGWGIEALCGVIGQLPGMAQWIAPRRTPGVWIDGTQLRVPVLEALAAAGDLPAFMAAPRELPAGDVDVVSACDGEKTIETMARQLGRGVEETAAAVGRLEAGGVLLRRLELPVDPHAERLLRAFLDGVGDEALRAQATTLLDDFESARAAVTRAAGDPAALNLAIEGVETTFTRLTGGAATRAEGQTYAARTLIYEDCRRDVAVDLGPDFLAELSGPLGLVLSSARWLTFDVARRYRAAFADIYRAEAEKTGGEVSLHAFSLRAQPLLGDANAAPLLAAADELTARWQQVFGPAADGVSRRDFRCEDLASRVAEAFAAPAPGWALARYVSPDVMIAAKGPEAFARGDYQLVLGEVHLANTIGRHALVEQHPDAPSLAAARARDIDVPCVIPVTSATWNVQRNGPALVQPDDVRFAYERPFAGPAGTPVVTIGECIVEERDGALIVRTRDGRATFDVIEFFGHTLSNQCLSYPRIVAAAAHTPRITVDRMVIARESWRLTPADLPFIKAMTARDLLIEARHFQRRLGMPRWVFAKIPGEQKPYFVDFESPAYLKMLAMIVTAAATAQGESCTIGLSEMLPDLDHLWLVDANGARYTSELRMVALDAAWPAAVKRTS